MVACAAIVGADVDDVRGESSEDAGHTNVPRDAGSADDAGPVLEAGGACPAGSGLTSCVVGGLDTCVNVTNDPANGDACGAVCSDDPHGVPVCVNGACTYACRGGFSLCDGGDGCCSVASVETDASTNDAAPPPSDLAIPCGNGESSFCEGRRPSFGNDVQFCNPAVTGE